MKKVVSKNIIRKINDISSFLNVKKFILYGGTAVDLLNNFNVSDYDIAIEYTNKKSILNVIRHLRKCGFSIVVPWREYVIQKNNKVILVYAKNKNYYLDIAFLKDQSLIGLYDIESTYISSIHMHIVDLHNGLTSLKRKRINLIREIESEDPYILLGRFIYLCAKYDIPISYKKHMHILLNLKKLCEIHKTKSGHFNTQIIPSFYSHVLSAIIKSKDKIRFIQALVDAQVFIKIFPSLNLALTDIIQNKQSYTQLVGINNRQDTIYYLSNVLDKNDKREFLKEFNKLKIRTWE